ncbi:hypothetical protein IFM12276_16900 [Nocardia sputorum]|uniref:Bacterial Ig-like domain-containing protein n=1 Tax=Nocardia sputorum TaxID=2984338 RepID=A0ABN6U0G0_9NOCA|nr:hypothetical protein IFM12276_16900 [Nocardia sputorum]
MPPIIPHAFTRPLMPQSSFVATITVTFDRANALPGLTTAGRDGEWRPTRYSLPLPSSYTLQARKNRTG